MAARRRRRFTADFRKWVALEALRGNRTVQEIAARHEVHPGGVGFGAESANLREPPCCQRNSMNTRAWPDQFRMQLWSGFYETTWVDYGQYGDPHASRFVRPLAGSATLISIDELVLVAQNVRAGTDAASVVAFRSWPRRTAGARPRQPIPVRRRGRSVRCGGPGRQWDALCGVDRARSRHRDRCNKNPAGTG